MYISNCYDEWWPTMTLHCKILTDLPTRCRIAKQRCRIPRRRCRIWDPPGSGWIPLLSPSQQCQSTEGTVICITLQINFQRTITKKIKLFIPNIRLYGENAIDEWFWWHPTNWQQSFSFLSVVIVLVNVSCESEVSNLHDVSAIGQWNQTVSCS